MFSKEAVVDHGAEDIEGGEDYIQQRVCVFGGHLAITYRVLVIW